jgi:hypothetical protein
MTAQQLNYSNFFETTLSAIVGASDNNFTIAAAPTSNGSSAISPPFYLVIDPDNETNKEVVLVTAVVGEMFADLHDQLVSGTITFTNKTFDAEGTGNVLSNVDVANLKSGVLDTDISSVSGSDDTLASAKAIKTYIDANAGADFHPFLLFGG